jgi:hypothetical protein
MGSCPCLTTFAGSVEPVDQWPAQSVREQVIEEVMHRQDRADAVARRPVGRDQRLQAKLEVLAESNEPGRHCHLSRIP